MASVVGASAQVANAELVEGMKYKELKHMYDFKEYSFDLDLHPSVNYVQTSCGAKPTAGLTMALKF